METLKQQIPEFSDEKKASAVRDKILSVGSKVYGYQPEEDWSSYGSPRN
jgi:hypothetical protein